MFLLSLGVTLDTGGFVLGVFIDGFRLDGFDTGASDRLPRLVDVGLAVGKRLTESLAWAVGISVGKRITSSLP